MALFDNETHWERGWVVYKSGWRPRFAGVFTTRQEAEEAARKAGDGYQVRYGSYDRERKDFATTGEFETI